MGNSVLCEFYLYKKIWKGNSTGRAYLGILDHQQPLTLAVLCFKVGYDMVVLRSLEALSLGESRAETNILCGLVLAGGQCSSCSSAWSWSHVQLVSGATAIDAPQSLTHLGSASGPAFRAAPHGLGASDFRIHRCISERSHTSVIATDTGPKKSGQLSFNCPFLDYILSPWLLTFMQQELECKTVFKLCKNLTTIWGDCNHRYSSLFTEPQKREMGEACLACQRLLIK